MAFKGFATSSYYLTQASFCNLLLNSFATLNKLSQAWEIGNESNKTYVILWETIGMSAQCIRLETNVKMVNDTFLEYLPFFLSGSRGREKGEFTNLQGISASSNGRVVVADSNNQCIQVRQCSHVFHSDRTEVDIQTSVFCRTL